MTEERTKPVYVNATFLGRKFIKKGQGVKGEWNLFTSNFLIGGKDTKLSAFANPKKGLCITALKEGTEYNIGYSSQEKTFVNEQNESITYNALTLTFVSDVKEGVVDSTPSPKPTVQDPQMPIDTQDLLKSYDESIDVASDIVLNNEQKALMEKLYKVPIDKVNEISFKDTVRGRLPGTDPTKVDLMWKFYLKNVR